MRRYVLAAVILLGACTSPPPTVAPAPVPEPVVTRMEAVPVLTYAAPQMVGMETEISARLDSLAGAAIADSAAPAVAIAVGRWGRLVHLRGYGTVDWAPGSAAVTDSTLFDLASVTKVVATTTAAMVLEEEGRISLDQRVAWYVPALMDTAKQAITVRQVFTHSGGFEAFAPLYRTVRGRDEYLRQIDARPLRHAPGAQTIYSDWDLVLAQAVIERAAGDSLDRFVARRVFGPLGMRDTGFRPSLALRDTRIAATEVDTARGGKIWGEVHDPNAWAMGGVAGHAGLFGSARDLAIFAQMLLNGGEYGGARILRPQTIARWTAPQGPRSSRALGWDTPSATSSAGRFFGPRSFGHTGYTGTSIWIDPERGLFVVLLTNRVNPTSANQKHVALRRAVADAVQSAVTDAPLIDWESRHAVKAFHESPVGARHASPGAPTAGTTPKIGIGLRPRNRRRSRPRRARHAPPLRGSVTTRARSRRRRMRRDEGEEIVRPEGERVDRRRLLRGGHRRGEGEGEEKGGEDSGRGVG